MLTRRIAYLLGQRGVHPGEIMAITFTNKAAAEMRERVAALVGRRANAMWVSTFHSMCVRILRREAKTLDMSSSFSIYDSDDTKRLITLVARDLDIDPKKYAARTLAVNISNLKNELVGPEDAAANAANDLERRVAEVYGEYQRRLDQANAFDFDDLIMRTVSLLQAFPDVAEYYRRRFRHVLVDEYQDTNHAQYTLVRVLAGTEASDSGIPPAELCVVGDADQSIYAFRGATIRNIEEFERDFPNAHTILLEQNYRSTQTILSAANAVIARNPNRRAKRLWTDSGDGEKIVGYVSDNDHDEAAFVAGEIDALAEKGEADYSDIAVFYRTNNQSRVFEEIFIRLGLPYKVVGGVRFYERREVRDMLAYLRVLANPDDTVSLRRILNVPKRGIGDRAEAVVATRGARADLLRGRVARRRRRQGGAAEPALCQGDHRVCVAARRLGRGRRLRRGGARPAGVRAGAHGLPRGARGVGRPAGRFAGGEPDRARHRGPGVHRVHRRGHPGRERRAGAGRRRPGSRLAARVPGAGVAGRGRRLDPGRGRRRGGRRRRGRGHADDRAHREGPGVPGGVLHRLGGRRLPAHARARRPDGAGGGAAPRVRRDHARGRGCTSRAPWCGRRGGSRR